MPDNSNCQPLSCLSSCSSNQEPYCHSLLWFIFQKQMYQMHITAWCKMTQNVTKQKVPKRGTASDNKLTRLQREELNKCGLKSSPLIVGCTENTAQFLEFSLGQQKQTGSVLFSLGQLKQTLYLSSSPRYETESETKDRHTCSGSRHGSLGAICHRWPKLPAQEWDQSSMPTTGWSIHADTYIPVAKTPCNVLCVTC